MPVIHLTSRSHVFLSLFFSLTENINVIVSTSHFCITPKIWCLHLRPEDGGS